MPKPQSILDNFSAKFPLLNRLYDLYQKMPDLAKNEENTLRKSSEITILEILELVVIATRQGKTEKAQTLRQAIRKLDTLRVFTDMAKELKNLSANKYQDMEETLQSVGKMLGGWLKSASLAK